MGKIRSDKEIQAIKATDVQQKISDGDGLFLIVQPLPVGSKLWQLRYRFAGKQKTCSFGQYPLVGLKEARDRSFEARKLLSNGADPMAIKAQQKATAVEADTAFGETVEKIAREWFGKFSSQWVEGHASKIIRRLERDLFPHFKGVGIASVKPASLLAVVRRVEERGALETAHRLMQNCSQVWRYAVATGKAALAFSIEFFAICPPYPVTPTAAAEKCPPMPPPSRISRPSLTT